MVSRHVLGVRAVARCVMCGCYGVTRWWWLSQMVTMEFVAFYWHDLALS